MKKEDLIEKVLRRLGYPMVKVELDNTQIIDHIDYARQQYIKWAVGNATNEVYFTVMLSGGQAEYQMDSGVVSVLGYESNQTGSVNTLFTMENFLNSRGAYDALKGGDSYSLVSYHLARDFLDTVRKYAVDSYTFVYHKYTNKLEIKPTPPTGYTLTIDEVNYDSPGFILVRAYEVEGDTTDIYGEPWILDYVTALSKMTLGRIRMKFANFGSIGNSGISMDGDALMSEGKEEKERLDEQLREEEPEQGYDISIGY